MRCRRPRVPIRLGAYAITYRIATPKPAVSHTRCDTFTSPAAALCRLGWGGLEPYVVSGHKALKALDATYTSFHDSILGMPRMDKFAAEGVPHVFGLPDAVFARPAEWPDDYVHTSGFWYVPAPVPCVLEVAVYLRHVNTRFVRIGGL